MNPASLNNKTILITGAAFDIGRALSLRCATLGANVLLLDQDSKGLDAIYDAIVTTKAPEPMIVEVDLAKLSAEAAQSINANIIDEYGQLDALVHTANWTFPLSPLAAYEEKYWQQAMHNLHFAPFMLTQSLLPALSAAAAARVAFNVQSCGRQAKAFWGPYGAAYAALENTCATWNSELNKTAVRFATIDPGEVLTQVRAKHYPAEVREELLRPDDEVVLSPYLKFIAS